MAEKKGFSDRMKERYERLRRFLNRDVWTLEPTRRLHRFLVGTLRTGILAVEGASGRDLLMVSKALTYKIAFALVPLLAVMLAVFQTFGGLREIGDQVKEFVLANVDPSKSGQFAEHIDRFIDQVDAPTIGVVGFLVLVYIAFSLLTTVERAFNRIWGVRRPRPIFRRLTVYWTLITVGPLFLAASLAVSTPLMEWIRGTVPILDAVLLKGASFVFAWIVFAALYVFMPNASVKVGPAVTGALIAGTVWVLTKELWVWYNTELVAKYEVYGSLGAIPVFLLWVYMSWVLVLIGAEIAFARQHVKTYQREVAVPMVSHRFKERLAVLVTVEAGRDFAGAKEAPTAETLAERTNTPVRLVHEVLEKLTADTVLREVSLPKEKLPGYVPGRDLQGLTVRDVLDALNTHGSDPFALPDGEQMEPLHRVVDEAQARTQEALSRVTIRDLLSKVEQGPASNTKQGGDD